MPRALVPVLVLLAVEVGAPPGARADPGAAAGATEAPAAAAPGRGAAAAAPPAAASGGPAAAPPLPRTASRPRGRTREWLAIAALLFLWLLTRLQRAEREKLRQRDARHRRRSPTTPDELGRAVFEVVRSGDLRGWRALFLSGPEAAGFLGEEGAARWLEEREPRLRSALERLAGELGARDVYAGTRLMEDRSCFLVVRREDGSSAFLPVGQVVRVGAVYRLSHPADPGGRRRPRGAPGRRPPP